METQKDLKDTDQFDWLESTEVAIDKRKFLLNRLFVKQPIPQDEDWTRCVLPSQCKCISNQHLVCCSIGVYFFVKGTLVLLFDILIVTKTIDWILISNQNQIKSL